MTRQEEGRGKGGDRVLKKRLKPEATRFKQEINEPVACFQVVILRRSRLIDTIENVARWADRDRDASWSMGGLLGEASSGGPGCGGGGHGGAFTLETRRRRPRWFMGSTRSAVRGGHAVIRESEVERERPGGGPYT